MTDNTKYTYDHLLLRLDQADSESELFLGAEEARQQHKLVLIPSESICPPVVRQVLGSVFTNLYAEGQPQNRATSAEAETSLELERQLAYQRRYADRRYYQGCDLANLVERLAKRRVAELFSSELAPAGDIFANVQPLSGAAANNAVYEAFLSPGDVFMGIDLTHGGHLTHGSPYNRSGRYYRVVSYGVNPETGRLDYDAIAALANRHHPRIIVAGASAYPWDIDWAALRRIADSLPHRPLLMADIAHPAGLVVAGLFPNPVGYADVTTFTTHKTMIGPRGAVILTTDADFAARIDRSIFPGEQGGPHINNIAAMAVAFKLAATPAFREVQVRTVANARTMAEAFVERGLRLAYGGTNTHLLLVDLKSVPDKFASRAWYHYPLKGDLAARILDLCGLVCNKNTIPGDTNAGDSSAVRFGLTWAAQRGLCPDDMDDLVDIIYYILSNIEPFHYIGTTGELPRGKVEFEVMDNAQSRVRSLLQRTADPPILHRGTTASWTDSALPTDARLLDAAGQSVAWCHLPDAGVLRVEGERSRVFLQGVLTSDVMSLKPGQIQGCCLLDRKARVIASPQVLCLEPDAFGRDQFLLVTEKTGEVCRWLEVLSDGFVRFDDDLLAKINGPVMIDYLEDMAVIALRGPQASIVSTRLAPDISGLRAGQFEENPDSDGLSILARTCDLDDYPNYLILCSSLYMSEAKLFARREVEAIGGAIGELAGAAVLTAGASSTADITKPYFIGQTSFVHDTSNYEPKKRFQYESPAEAVRPSCLHAEHLKLTARRNMVNFAGWEMPVWYTTTRDEHQAIRTTAGLFDLSHMGVLDFEGPDAGRVLDMLCTNYVVWLQEGQSHYSYLLDPDGQVIDDIFIYRVGRERYLVVVNAANAQKAEDWFKAANEGEVLIDNRYPFKALDGKCVIRNLKEPSAGSRQLVDLALQGPCSGLVLQSVLDSIKDTRKLARLPKFGVMEASIGGSQTYIARTGYTGEAVGFEVFIHPDRAPAFWQLVLEKGKSYGMLPCGLGARDSARTEAGLPLYGHELAGPYSIGPGGAGYASFVRLNKPFFVGRAEYIAAEQTRQSAVVRFRIEAPGVRMARLGDPVVNNRGAYVGAVTSSVMAGGSQVGMAYIDRRYVAPGTKLAMFPGASQSESIPSKPPAHLVSGDRVALPVEATVIERFMTPKTPEVLQTQERAGS